MIDDEPVHDADGLPHRSYDADIYGVPYSFPTCGLCGTDWPCEEKQKQQGVTHN